MMPYVLSMIPFRAIFSFIKKAFVVTFAFTVVILLFMHFLSKDRMDINPVQVQTAYRQELYRKMNNPAFQKTKADKLMLSLYKKMICKMTGDFCSDNADDYAIHQQNSVVGFISRLVTLPLSSPPASGIYWAQDSLENSGFIPKTYAAEGIGFAAIKPIINLWKIFRDISYLMLVLMLMAIGFMIMFRMKINPQTVINVENALPKIIVALLLITFSFAIAGFLIDLMYVVIAILINLLSGGGRYFNPGQMQDSYLNGRGLDLWDSIFANPAHKRGFGVLNLIGIGTSLMFNIMTAVPAWISSIVFMVLNVVIGYLLTQVINSFLYSTVGTSLNDIAGQILTFGGAVGDLPQLITFIPVLMLAILLGFFFGPMIIILALGALIFFTLLFLYFRIFFLLFRAYLQILILIILSPVILLFEAVPGKSTFAYWFKNLLAEIMTFPIVIGIMTMGFVIANQLASSALTTNSAGELTFWKPPFMNIIDPSLLPILIGMGFILIIPDIVKLAKEQLFGVKGLPFNIGIGTFFGGAGAAGGGAVSMLGQISTINLGMGAIFGPDWRKGIKPQPKTREEKQIPSGAPPAA